MFDIFIYPNISIKSYKLSILVFDTHHRIRGREANFETRICYKEKAKAMKRNEPNNQRPKFGGCGVKFGAKK